MPKFIAGLQATKLVDDLVNGRKQVVMLSDMQITYINFNLTKASQSLTKEQFLAFQKKFETYMKLTQKREMTLNMYYERMVEIIRDFEAIAPYYYMTEDSRAYEIALEEERNNKTVISMYTASVNFMNATLADKVLMDGKLADDEIYLGVMAYNRFMFVILSSNALIDISLAHKETELFEKYVITNFAKSIKQQDVDYAAESLAGLISLKNKNENNMIDMVMASLTFGAMYFYIDITDKTQAAHMWFYTRELQKAILDGNYYGFLKLD